MKGNKKYKTVLSGRKILGEGHLLLEFNGDFRALVISPGQFVMLGLPEESGCYLRRPLAPVELDEEKIVFYVRVAGKGTAWLENCAIGTGFDLVAPLGRGFEYLADRTYLIVAGGCGIASVIPFWRQALEGNNPSVLVYAGKSKEDMPLLEYLGQMTTAEEKLVVMSEDGSCGTKGLATDMFPAEKPEMEIVSCGPVGMLDAVLNLCRERGMRAQVSLEDYMGCGMGLCMSCSKRFPSGRKRICVDGPVFSSEDIGDVTLARILEVK